MATDTRSSAPDAPARSLVSLLGEQRAAIVLELRRVGEASVTHLAGHLGISEVATRRHLAVLADEGLLEVRQVARERGRPAAHYRLAETADQLFPQAYDRFATEVLDFLEETSGSAGVRAFLRWRLDRQVDDLQAAVTAEQLHDRLSQLAGALSEAGFAASVREEAGRFTLVQDHCAIGDVAREHPEVCTYEAATFSKVLGRDVRLTRRETLATGGHACVCTVTPQPDHPAASNDPDDPTDVPGEPT